MSQDRAKASGAKFEELCGECRWPLCPVGKLDEHPSRVPDWQCGATLQAFQKIGQELFLHTDKEFQGKFLLCRTLTQEFGGHANRVCVATASVRCGDEDACPILNRNAEHRQRLIKVSRTVIETGQYMTVDIDLHRQRSLLHETHPFPLSVYAPTGGRLWQIDVDLRL